MIANRLKKQDIIIDYKLILYLEQHDIYITFRILNHTEVFTHKPIHKNFSHLKEVQ